MFGRNTIAEALLARGAEVNARDDNGDTPLHDAVAMSALQVIKTLRAAGADVRISNHEGKTPLDLAEGAAKFAILEPMKKESP